jgi:hypothetical protein
VSVCERRCCTGMWMKWLRCVPRRSTSWRRRCTPLATGSSWKQLEAIEVTLDKDGDDIPDELLLRELAVLPLLRIPNPNQAPTYLFQDYGVLRFLGFAVTQIREGFNEKGVRSPTGQERMRPHHRDTLYHALKHVKIDSLSRFREAHQQHWWNTSWCRGGRMLWMEPACAIAIGTW